MVEGVILTQFDDIKGFVSVAHFPLNIKADLIKSIIFRATIFAMGGVDDLTSDRETLIDLREEGVIGVTYMSAVDAPYVRGRQMPIILIYFTSISNRYALYQNMTEILKMNKDIMEEIKPLWSETQFLKLSQINDCLKEIYQFTTKIISDSMAQIGTPNAQEINFNVKCPECSNEAVLRIPKTIEKLLSIPVTDLPCGHQFEVYFTKGPTFRGTSMAKDLSHKNDNLKDLFEKI